MIFKYRPEIDGLRALAIIPVVFFHAGFNFFNGGFVGVDIFFVISGYLITSIIIKQLDNNTFLLKSFYERRARRILPALIFVIIISSLLSFIFLTQSELLSYFKSVISTLLFISNLYFYKTTPYFASEADLEPLLHTWSLSIEEQFYILFPIMFLFFYNFYKKYIFLFFIFVFIASLFICQFLVLKTGGSLNFYFTLSRVWELALGAICAYLIIYKNLFFSHFFKNLFSIIGVIAILFSIFYFNRQTPHPSFYSLIPTVGTALVILFANKETLVQKILSIKLFVYTGLVSYSLYLWHQPLLAFGRIFFDDFSIIEKLLLLLCSLLLSIFSYHFIEKFFRNRKKINLNFFFTRVIVFIILIISFSYLSINFFSKNSTEDLLAKLLSKNEAVYVTKIDERKFIKKRIIHENLKPKILVIGSSRVMQVSNTNFNQQILNLGVSGASIEDHIAITLMALEKFDVNTVLLGADPWLFNKYNYQSRWKTISEEYKLSLKNIQSNVKHNNIIKDSNTKNIFFYEKLINKLYNFLNIRKLDLEIKKKQINNLKKDIILKDGRRVYNNREIKEKLKPKLLLYSMNDYEFSDEYYTLYKSFINYLSNVYKKKVILVLSPYHHPSYQLTVQTKPFYLDAENKFRELSKETNIKLVGSYDASLTFCDSKEFYDHMHPKNSCMAKILNKIN